MEKSSKRGKIPQQDWPSIITRYEAGETLASIARTYDCSPPAISYIVSRTRARSAAAEAAAPSAPIEPQLIKGPSSPTPINSMPASAPMHNGASAGGGETSTIPVSNSGEIERLSVAMKPSDGGLFPNEPHPPRMGEAQRPSEIGRPAQHYGHGPRELQASGQAASVPPAPSQSSASSQNGEARRTLHLSLSQGNGSGPGGESHPAHIQNAPSPAYGSDNRPVARPQGFQAAAGQQPRPSAAAAPAPELGPALSPLGAVRAPAPTADSHPPREAGAFIDQALRERIDGDIAAFLAAFDAALDHDTPESRTGLREATDRLLRAGARTRIELERLEARVPLASRDKDRQAQSSFFRPR